MRRRRDVAPDGAVAQEASGGVAADVHGGAGTVAADAVVAAGAELMADGAEEAAGAGAERSYGWEGLGTGGTRTCTSFPSVGLGDTGWGRVSSQM